MPQSKLLLFPLLLICAEIAAYLSNDMYLPALPDIMRDFGIGEDQVQLSLSSWFLGSMSMQLLVGPLSDRVGRRPVLICGMILFVFSSLACALASHYTSLLFARFIQGSTVCFIIVAGYASIHELFDQKNAISLLAKMNSVSVLAPAFGPLIGGLIVSSASWRWTFWPLFILGLVILLLLLKWMPEPLPLKKRHPLKMGLLLKQYKSLLLNRRFILLLLPYSLLFCGFIAWLAAGPFLVIKQFHCPPFVFGIYQVVIFSFFILSNRLVKRMMESMGLQRLIVRGLGFAFAGALLASLAALILPGSMTSFIPGMALYSFGHGFCCAPLQRLAIEASTEPMGSRMALVSTSLGLFGLLATGLVNVGYNGRLISLAAILLLTATLSVLASLLELSERKVSTFVPGKI